MQASEIASIIRVPSAGAKIATKVRTLPLLEVDYFIQPITRGVLKVRLCFLRGCVPTLFFPDLWLLQTGL